MSLRSINHLHRGLKSYAAPRLATRYTFVQTAGFASKPGSKSLKPGSKSLKPGSKLLKPGSKLLKPGSNLSKRRSAAGGGCF